MASVISSSEADLSSITDTEEETLTDLSDGEIFLMVQDSIRANEVLKLETKMFENFLKRVDPKDLEIQPVGAGGNQKPTQRSSTEQSQRSFRKKSRVRRQSIDRLLKLTAEQKCDIATRELEELKDSLEKMNEVAERKLDNFRAVMEEAEVRYTEVKKAEYEFQRDIVNGAVNPRTGRVYAEKLIRSIDEKLRARDALIEKLRLKNSTLKVQKKKLLLQLKQKEEMGEVLHEVDFNQLKIENSQYLEKIDERNQDLLRLKLMATNTLQVLNKYKEKLHVLTLESDRLKSEISQRKDLLMKIDIEMNAVEHERNDAEDTNRGYRQRLQDYKVPDVMEYVQEKAQLYDLKKAVQSWERKVEIASMALKTLKSQWNKMKFNAGVHLNHSKHPMISTWSSQAV